MRAQAHKLGFGNGKIRDNGDGTASYYRSLALTLTVRIADITGFAQSNLEFRIIGHGAELASTVVPPHTGVRIEAWFRAHPDFGRSTAPAPAPAAPQLEGRLVADELVKLAGLRDAGVLTDDEFTAQKVRLLG